MGGGVGWWPRWRAKLHQRLGDLAVKHPVRIEAPGAAAGTAAHAVLQGAVRWELRG